MANASLKKSIILFVFSFLLTFTAFSQRNPKEFSTDFQTFMIELSEFMSISDNDESKNIYRKFLRQSENFTKVEQYEVIKISNKMLLKRLKSNPYFFEFLSTIIAIDNSRQGDFLLLEWLNVFNKAIAVNTKNKLLLFCVFSNDLVSQNILRSSKTTHWNISQTNFHFIFDITEPAVVFDTPFNLSCSTVDGSYTIFDTQGKYNFISNEWFGNNGSINWEQHGYSKDSVFVEIRSYKIDTRKSTVVADSSMFFNKNIFSSPIEGKLINMLTKGKKAKLFPKFTSYSKNLELKEIFQNIDYRGGYKIQGKEFVAEGGKYAEAKIVFKRNGRDVFIANANRFSISSDRIVAKEAGVKIFFDTDSIYHSNLQFKYIDSQRKLQLYRKVNGISGAPMLNTYHNITMDFELLEWDIDTDIINFGSLPGSAESRVEFESVDRYLKSKFESLQGIDAIHPLILVKKYINAKQEETFYVKDFARFAYFPLLQIQHYLIQLANEGFIFYDFDMERVTVLPKLFNYVNAASDLGDYDVISFKSIIKSGQYQTGDKNLVNAALNLKTKDLNVLGIHNIQVSQKRGVYFYPKNGLIVIKKDRDFLFNGQVFAGRGRLNLFGRDFLFHYDDFKVDLNHIDSVQLSVPLQPIQRIRGNEVLTPVKTVIEAVTGDLKIDHPTNKSGIRRDSFPEYPIFSSYYDSYAYYDKKSIYDGVYDRDRFSFHLQPFTIDSLDNYSGKGLWFAGSFESAGIFPSFDDTLRLQPDYSLGFNRTTPREGFEIYGGKGRYYNDIDLSHEGLKGSGDFEYLTTKASAKEIFFFPDSANLYTQSIIVNEVLTGIEFPSINNTETYAHFQPYNDRLDVSRIGNDFNFYNSQATFNGNLLIRPTGVTGGGIMTLDKAKVNANLFTYNANWFGSDTASLRVFEKNGNVAFKANDLKTHIDLVTREGYFYSNGTDSYVELPANQYITYIDNLRWEMDNESLTLGDEQDNSDGSEFISVHPNQDSLSFFAKTTFYSLKDYIIHAAGVEKIQVADAMIFPDSGIVTVAKEAVIETLFDAQIIADDLTEYHKFTDATIDISSAHSYMASGNYTYKDAMNSEQQIFFKEITVDEDTITIASGDVDTDELFHIDSNFDFKGSIDLIADQKNLTFDGVFMVNHSCSLLDKEWIKFQSIIDPENIKFILDEKLYNENNDLLSTALVMSFDSTNFYSTFLSKKKRSALDISILPASYTLQYNNLESAYIVGGPDSLSNYYTLYDKACKTKGEGIIDLNLDLGQVGINSIGNITHNMNSKETEIEGFLMLDFLFSSDALNIMAEDLFTAPGDELFEYDERFAKNLSRVVGKDKAEIHLVDLAMTDEYSNFPDEMNNSIVFAKTKLKWDDTNKAYVAKGSIAVSSIMEKQVNAFLDGYIIIEKGQNSDILTIYLMTELYDEYYFQYKNGVMIAWSTNIDFTTAINDVKPKKRRADKVKGQQSYRYMSGNDDVTEKFLKNVKKKY